jgi:hypothetical protein
VEEAGVPEESHHLNGGFLLEPLPFPLLKWWLSIGTPASSTS